MGKKTLDPAQPLTNLKLIQLRSLCKRIGLRQPMQAKKHQLIALLDEHAAATGGWEVLAPKLQLEAADLGVRAETADRTEATTAQPPTRDLPRSEAAASKVSPETETEQSPALDFDYLAQLLTPGKGYTLSRISELLGKELTPNDLLPFENSGQLRVKNQGQKWVLPETSPWKRK